MGKNKHVAACWNVPGYTRADIENARHEAARNIAMMNTKMTMAAMCIVLHDRYGFGAQRCEDVMTDVSEKVINALTPTELADECRRKIGRLPAGWLDAMED